MAKYIWDERYDTDEYVFGKAPNTFFKKVIDTLTPGKIFVPAAGEGRDAVYAAKLGWDVYAMDLSNVGREKALRLAKENNVTIHYEIGDILAFNGEPNSFDAIAMIYFHVPSAIRPTLHHAMIKLLKPGGTLFLEGYNPKQLNNTSGGPKDLDMLHTTQGLANDFDALTIIQNEEMETVLEEGPRHTGKADIIRLIAKKQP